MTGPVALRVLVADPVPEFIRRFASRLEGLVGWRVAVDSCESGADLLQRIYAQPLDLVFLNLDLPESGGLDLLTRFAQTSLPLPIVVLSDDNGVRPAVEAMKRGVLDLILKQDIESMDLEGFLGRLRETFRLKRENAELHQINQMKNDFLATISHELRTPLTSILGMSELLLGGRMGAISDKQADGLRKIADQTQNLSRLINQLLDVQATVQERKRSEFRPVCLAELAERRVEGLRPLFEKKGVALRASPPPERFFVRGDADALRKVIEHLLLNALKFTPAGGTVGVELRALPKNLVLLTVTDTGQGIPQETLPFLFQKFFHADPSLTRAYGGLGLGLAYCQHVIDKHGGRVWIESPGAGKGTTANVSLTRVDPHGPVRREDGDKAVVVWVDDNPAMLELVEAGFAAMEEPIRLLTFRTGPAALEEVRARPPNLLVLDIMMPGMNGLELLSHVKADPRTRDIPVLVVTGYREAAQEAVDRGAVDFFLKPFRMPDMLDKIRRQLIAGKAA